MSSYKTYKKKYYIDINIIRNISINSTSCWQSIKSDSNLKKNAKLAH